MSVPHYHHGLLTLADGRGLVTGEGVTLETPSGEAPQRTAESAGWPLIDRLGG